MRFAGKLAFIAGAGASSPGCSNGKAVAVLLAREGARVFALDHSAEHLGETVDAIRAAGGTCHPHVADVSCEDDVRAAVERCMAEFCRIDVPFNFGGLQALAEAGRHRRGRLEHAVARQPQVDVPDMPPCPAGDGAARRRRGCQQSSLAAVSFLYPSIAYSSSKGAVDAFTRNLAVQYAARGIRVVAVRPGLMATPRITGRMREKFGDGYEAALNERHKVVPMGRMGDAWAVAHAVAFLASDEARYITATELVVDGGLSASALGRPWADDGTNL